MPQGGSQTFNHQERGKKSAGTKNQAKFKRKKLKKRDKRVIEPAKAI